jgi:hypothetical protein
VQRDSHCNIALRPGARSSRSEKQAGVLRIRHNPFHANPLCPLKNSQLLACVAPGFLLCSTRLYKNLSGIRGDVHAASRPIRCLFRDPEMKAVDAQL